MLQQHGGWVAGVAAVADELFGPDQPGSHMVVQRDREPAIVDHVAGHLAMAAERQRRGLVENLAGLGNHAGATDRVVAATARGPAILGEGVGAVQGIVQAAPAGICRVQRVARVGHRHDELRSGHAGDLGIDTLRADREVRRLRLQIADPTQEFPIGIRIGRLAAVFQMPAVDLALQLIAPVEQRLVTRRKIADQRGQSRPECCLIDPGAGNRLGIDEIVQRARDLHAAGGHEIH